MKKIKKVKILLVTPYFYPNKGGLETYCYNLAKNLRKTYGWEIIVVTSNEVGKKTQVKMIKGMKIYRLKTLFTFSNTPVNPMWLFEIKKIISFEKPDIINAHSPVPYIADIAAFNAGKIPFILTYHAGTMIKNKVFLDLLITVYEKYILRQVMRKAVKIICVSKFVKNTMANSYKSKGIVIYPGVDTKTFRPEKLTTKNKYNVLFVAKSKRMYEMKGLYYLIDAMKNIPAAQLIVIGDKIKCNIGNVNFIGTKNSKSLAREINKSNVLVLCPTDHVESFGISIIEAMACKVPVIGTRVGGIPEVITDGENGLLIPPKNSRALEVSINKILQNASFANTLGRNGYKKVSSHFLWKNQVEKNYNVFMSLLN